MQHYITIEDVKMFQLKRANPLLKYLCMLCLVKRKKYFYLQNYFISHIYSVKLLERNGAFAPVKLTPGMRVLFVLFQ